MKLIKNALNEYLLIFLFITACLTTWDAQDIYAKWMAVLIFSALLISYQVSKKLHWSAGLSYFAVLMNGIMVFAWWNNWYYNMDTGPFLQTMKYALYSVLTFIMLTVPIIYLDDKYLIKIVRAIAGVCIITSFITIGQAIFGKSAYLRYAVFGNASMNACLIAFTLPFLYKVVKDNIQKRWTMYILIAPIVAILLTGSSQGSGILITLILLYFFKRNYYKYLSIVPVLVFIAWYFSPDEFFNNSQRFDFWKMYLGWWVEHANYWFGVGVGTTPMYAISMQMHYNFAMGNWWAWAHGDWVQLLFEQGIAGLLSFILLFIFALIQTIRNEQYFLRMALIAYGLAALANYGAHMAAHALIGICIVVLCFRYKEVKSIEFTEYHL